jgi:hypothetical protein
MTGAMVEEDLEVFTESEEPIWCESPYERDVAKKPAHLAHWYVFSDCNEGITAVCEARRLKCLTDDGWVCVPGCGEKHEYNELRWIRIPTGGTS